MNLPARNTTAGQRSVEKSRPSLASVTVPAPFRNESSPRSPFENPLSAVDYISARGLGALRSARSPLEMWSSRMTGGLGTGPGTMTDLNGLHGFTGWGLGEAADSFDLDTDEEEDCNGGLLSGSPEKWASLLAAVTPPTHPASVLGAGAPAATATGRSKDSPNAAQAAPLRRTQAGAAVRRSVTSPAASNAATIAAAVVQQSEISRSTTTHSGQSNLRPRRPPASDHQARRSPPARAPGPVDVRTANSHQERQPAVARSPSMPDLQIMRLPADGTSTIDPAADGGVGVGGSGYTGRHAPKEGVPPTQPLHHGQDRDGDRDGFATASASDRERVPQPPQHRPLPPPAMRLAGQKPVQQPLGKQKMGASAMPPLLHTRSMEHVEQRPGLPHTRAHTEPVYLPPLDLGQISLAPGEILPSNGDLLLERMQLGSHGTGGVNDSQSATKASTLSTSPLNEDDPMDGNMDGALPPPSALFTHKTAAAALDRETYAQVAASSSGKNRRTPSPLAQDSAAQNSLATPVAHARHRRPSAPNLSSGRGIPARQAHGHGRSAAAKQPLEAHPHRPLPDGHRATPARGRGAPAGLDHEKTVRRGGSGQGDSGAHERPTLRTQKVKGNYGQPGRKRVSRSLERPEAVLAAEERRSNSAASGDEDNGERVAPLSHRREHSAQPQSTVAAKHALHQRPPRSHSAEKASTLQHPKPQHDREGGNGARSALSAAGFRGVVGSESTPDLSVHVAQGNAKQQILDGLRSPNHRGDADDRYEQYRRQLLRYGPVLQVITSRMVKDRVLFLFQEVLLVAKPIMPEGKRLVQADENTGLLERYQCRAIIPLGDISMATIREEATSPPDMPGMMDPEMYRAVRSFPGNSYRVLRHLLEGDLLRRDAASIAGFLLRTRGLDRREVGSFLAQRENSPVLAAFLERVPARGIALPDMLRLVGRHMRLPVATSTSLRLTASHTDDIAEATPNWRLRRSTAKEAEHDAEGQPDGGHGADTGVSTNDANSGHLRARCLVMIADRWREGNPSQTIGRRAAVALAYAVLALCRQLQQHASRRPKQVAGGDYTVEDFMNTFAHTYLGCYEDDGQPIYVSDQILQQTYAAAVSRHIMLDHDLDDDAVRDGDRSLHPTANSGSTRTRDVECDPSGRLWISVGAFPLRLTVRVPSAEIVFRLPRPDAGVQLRVLTEEGLRCSSKVISFGSGGEARITLTGVSVGRCVVAFDLMGPGAPRYSPIPPRTLSIERGFMRWAFRVRCEATYFSREDLPPSTQPAPGLHSPTLYSSGHAMASAPSFFGAGAGKTDATVQDDEEQRPLAARTRLNFGDWMRSPVGRGRAVKLSFSVESRDRRTSWCTTIEERARAVREARDHALPPSAPIGEADRPGRATRDRVVATQLGRLLLPASDGAASGSLIFTGKELVRLVAHHEQIAQEHATLSST
ncbi:hypothetical protein THASP1DRAFT_27436 [Thamnocephalis sphaerospora]|uniref:SEC7 domain-containing protein n=1 Tax=Thamnocephalis sphaerospora TaxID=78915 RepID=A0A4P9XXL1_9FUNG|nr:hypothetical protein THASP1DRAFT_27436 [Thamnocephalis sphaerospora]|eukprot:RKP10782.1 hypothetical protein THASP1DRAFT_27436 [Thamnocephalis sphaerospora]